MATHNTTREAGKELLALTPAPPPPPPPSPTDSDRVLVITMAAKTVDGANSTNALELVFEHLAANEATASLRPLRALSKPSTHRGYNWHPSTADDTRPVPNVHVLRAHSKIDRQRLESALRQDGRVAKVYRPPAYREPIGSKTGSRKRAVAPTANASVVAPAAAPGVGLATDPVQWGLELCGFREAWHKLEIDVAKAKPIGMIDIGNDRRHPELEGVITPVDLLGASASIADHASSVAAIMCALRNGGGVGDEDMVGCCSAKVVLYNVWTRHDGLNHEALWHALQDAIKRNLPVINISIWTDVEDQIVKELIAECEANNIIVVAAMGNAGDSGRTFYPAADPNVIAVAATDAADQRHIHSSIGKHAFIAAPGENIFTTVGNSAYDRVSGTSFAAAFVSAAVWLAKCKCPELTNDDVRTLLSRSVAIPSDERSPEVGYGRLDMWKLADQLEEICKSARLRSPK